jgi:hypothetical protein
MQKQWSQIIKKLGGTRRDVTFLGSGNFIIPTYRGSRHIPRDMLSRDPRITKRFRALSGEGRAQDDSQLIQFIRNEIIEERRDFIPKMSHELYITPQAKEVATILHKKVGNIIRLQ